MKKKWIDRRRWFEEITGLPEQEWKRQKATSVLNPSGDGKTLYIQNIRSGIRHAAGAFEVLSIFDLKEKLYERASIQSNVPIFEIRIREDEESLHCVDVAHLQSCARPHSLFQVASNFNAAEAAHRHRYPDAKDFVTFYACDSTQGPVASASAGVAAITRIHAPFYNRHTAPETWGQTEKRQVELLGDRILRSHFPVQNGKLIFRGDEPRRFNEHDPHFFQAVRIGLHRDVRAIFGRRNMNMTMLRVPSPPTIDQVFVAALNRQAPHPHPKHLVPKTIFLLRAAYHGTYMTALYRKTKDLYLTLVGGGSFQNPRSLIADAIASAHRQWAQHPSAHSLRRVILVLYPIGGDASLITTLREAFCRHELDPNLMQIHRYRNGRSTSYS
ncbi:MAG: hypothetical protein VX278_21645 [Myxococcota bacterium]|nr:hypothetical protein [Myxococcota bacterium]